MAMKTRSVVRAIALSLLAGLTTQAAPPQNAAAKAPPAVPSQAPLGGPAAAQGDAELDALTAKLQKAGPTAADADVAQLLRLARAAGRPAQAAPIAKAYLGQATKPSAQTLALAAENAWLTADYRTAVTRYKAYLRIVEPSADASAAAAQLYRIQVEFLGDKEDAFRFMRDSGDDLRASPASRRYDNWFLNEARERRDLPAIGKRLASAVGDKLPLEQERLFFWDFLEAGMQQLTRAPNAAESIAAFRKAVGGMRDGGLRTLKYNCYLAYLDLKTGRTTDFAPVRAATQAYFDAAPTVETLKTIGALFLGGDGAYVEAEWNRQAAAKREFIAAAFEKLDDAGKAAFLTWRYDGRAVQRDFASPEQWAALGAKYPSVFQNVENIREIPLAVPTADAALLKKQAPFLQGVPLRQAAVIRAVASSDNLADVLRNLVRNESWHLAPGDFQDLIARDVWPAFKALPRADGAQTAEEHLQKSLAASGGETVAGTLVALFDPQAVRAWLEAVWRSGGGADENDKSRFLAAIRSLEWAQMSSKDRKAVYEGLQRTVREWSGAMKRANNNTALAQAPALESALDRAMAGRAAAGGNPAPNPLCQAFARIAQAWYEKNGAEFIRLSREAYPLVRDYDEKKTPFGAAALAFLLQTPDGVSAGDFQADVLRDQAGNRRFGSVAAAILRGRPNWRDWSSVPASDQADAQKLNAAFEQILLSKIAQGGFSGETFDLYRAIRRGKNGSSQQSGSAVLEKMIASKTLLTHPYRPSGELRSGTVSYQWLVRNEFPALAAKFPVETAFDDLFVEESQKTGFLDAGYWLFGTDSKRKVATVAAKLLAQHETIPFGFDGKPARYTREAFWDWHERALGADKEARDAFLAWIEGQYGKGRYDEYAMGRGWLTASTGAPRAEFFARLASFVERAQTAPSRLPFPRLALAERLPRGEALTDSERATLRAALLLCAPPVWLNGFGYEDWVPLLMQGAGPSEGLELAPHLWRIAKNTGNGNAQRALVQGADAAMRAKALNLASAISSSGLELLNGELPADARALLTTVRSQSMVSIGGAIPVDSADPRYPVYAAQVAYMAGNFQAAWETYVAHADQVPAMIRELDPKFTIWLIDQNARIQQFARAEALARALVPWLERAGASVDAETRARLLIAYANIAFERREYPKARALFERIVTADEFNETRAKDDAELRIAEVDRLSKQYDKAFEALDRLTRRKDRGVQTEAFLQLARLKFEQEEYPDARNFLNQALIRAPDHAEGRILEGKLDLKSKRLVEATEVKVGLTTSQRILVPGKPIKVRLEDQNLAVVGKADSIEIRAWTDSGDEEVFTLVPFGDSKTKFEGSLPTAMGPLAKGDHVLQVRGDDTVHYDFTDRFKKAHNISAAETFTLTVATDSELYASSGRILTKEEMAERQFEAMLREKIKIEKEPKGAGDPIALSLVRPPDQVKPGNAIQVRVVDPDRNITPGRDQVRVRVMATSGDAIGGFALTETEAFSGVFEGSVPTAAAQAMATASNSEEGKQPNFAISGGHHPAWVALADNARPKLFTVDLHDNVALGKLTLRDDVAGRKLKRFAFQTSLNGREFSTLGAWPEPARPWEGALTVSCMKTDARTRTSTLGECRAAFQSVSRPYEAGVQSLSVSLDAPLAAAGLSASPGSLAHLRGAFYLDTRQVRTFRLDAPADAAVRYLMAIDGQAAVAAPVGGGRTTLGPLEIRKSFAKGVHRLDVFAVIAGPAKAAFNLQWDIEQAPFFATCPATLFDPAVHPEIRQEVRVVPATVTPATDGLSFDMAFAPKTQARVFRFILEDFEGDAPAVTRIELADAAGKRILPTEQDLTLSRGDSVLQMIPGDRITVSYEDPKTVTPGQTLLQASLAATYVNASLNICFAEYAGDSRRASFTPVRRFTPGEPLAIVINDSDRDTSDKPDTVRFTVRTTDGKPVEVEALETDAHSGVFVGKIFPVTTPPQRATELQVREADDITVTYLDPENTDPGVPWERSDTVEQAVYVAPQLRMFDVTSTLLDDPAVAGREKKRAAGGAADSTALGDESFPATRSLLAMRPLEASGSKPGRAILDGPVFVEVMFPTIALSGRSQTALYAQTSSGRKKAGKTDADPFDIQVPGTIQLTAGPGDAGRGATPPGYRELIVRGDGKGGTALDDGRFTFLVPTKLGETPAKTLVVGADDPKSSEPPALSVKGGDEIWVGYAYKTQQGETRWLTARAILGSDAFFDVMDRKFQEPVTGAHVGESFYLRVMDKSKDLSAAKDQVSVTVNVSSGLKRTVSLTETFENTGIFKGHLLLVHAQEQAATNSPASLPVQYGDTVTVTYPSAGETSALHRSVLVFKGADGAVLPFTKRFKDPEIAVQTQFTIAESYFELAKKHRELGEESLSRREIGQGKKVLEEVLRDNPETSAKAQADYLLANLSLEFANMAVDEAARKKHYIEAVGRFTDIVASFPDSPYAPKAQFKKALTFEKMGEIDQACEEYVKLSYRYPDNELVAETIARLGQYFFTKGRKINEAAEALKDNPLAQAKKKSEARALFKTAAEVFGRLAVRFPEHKLAGRTTTLSGQCYMRAEELEKAVQTFARVIERASGTEPEVVAEAMYWCGDCHIRQADFVNAYRMLKKLTWDYPETKWAKFARGRLTEPQLTRADQAEGR